MYLIRVKCPHPECGKSLIDDTKQLNGASAVKLKACKGGDESILYLSSIYDDFSAILPEELRIKNGDVIVFSCPYCGKQFPEISACPICGAPLDQVNLESGGELVFCTRKGCKHHGLEFASTDDLMRFIESNSAMK